MTNKPKLAIIIQGGVVQAIISDHPERIDLQDVLVIDYDTEGGDWEDFSQVPQSSGGSADAYVLHWRVTQSGIDLDGIVYPE